MNIPGENESEHFRLTVRRGVLARRPGQHARGVVSGIVCRNQSDTLLEVEVGGLFYFLFLRTSTRRYSISEHGLCALFVFQLWGICGATRCATRSSARVQVGALT